MIPVILSGGSGSRLWPLSRKSFPKGWSEVVEFF
nr:sugar phosphate nucleotidyltransferase [Stutzerimonas frequens]